MTATRIFPAIREAPKVVAVALAGVALVGCNPSESAKSPQPTAPSIPVAPLPPLLARNEIGVPTGDALRINHVAQFDYSQSGSPSPVPAATAQPGGGNSQYAVRLRVEYTTTSSVTARPASAHFFYLTDFANLRAPAGDFSGPVGLFRSWISDLDIVRQFGGDSTISGIAGRTREGDIAGGVFQIAAEAGSPQPGVATFSGLVDGGHFPPVCLLNPDYVGVVLFDADSRPLSNVSWIAVPPPRDCGSPAAPAATRSR